jgi:hypothetical protein
VYNRDGEVFDSGETFSDIEYRTGLKTIEELHLLVPGGMTL